MNVLIIFLLSLTIVACVETIQVPDSVVEQLNEKIDQLESSVTTLPTKSIEVPDSVVGQLKEKIGQLESSVTTLSSKSSTLTNQESQIDKLSEKINQLETKILSLEKIVDQNTTQTLNQPDLDTNNNQNTDVHYTYTTDGFMFVETFNGHTIYDWKCDTTAADSTVAAAVSWVIDIETLDQSNMDFDTDTNGAQVPSEECLSRLDNGFDQEIHSLVPGSLSLGAFSSDNTLRDLTHNLDALDTNSFSLSGSVVFNNANGNSIDKLIITYKYFLTNPSLQRDSNQ